MERRRPRGSLTATGRGSAGRGRKPNPWQKPDPTREPNPDPNPKALTLTLTLTLFRYEPARGELMRQALERIKATEGLSKDTYEIASRSLA